MIRIYRAIAHLRSVGVYRSGTIVPVSVLDSDYEFRVSNTTLEQHKFGFKMFEKIVFDLYICGQKKDLDHVSTVVKQWAGGIDADFVRKFKV